MSGATETTAEKLARAAQLRADAEFLRKASAIRLSLNPHWSAEMSCTEDADKADAKAEALERQAENDAKVAAKPIPTPDDWAEAKRLIESCLQTPERHVGSEISLAKYAENQQCRVAELEKMLANANLQIQWASPKTYCLVHEGFFRCDPKGRVLVYSSDGQACDAIPKGEAADWYSTQYTGQKVGGA